MKTFLYNSKLKSYARKNKKHQTEAERLLWFYLRARRFLGYKFRRQYPVKHYILDFYCKEKHVCIEVDGSQHQLNRIYDTERTKQLNDAGIAVIRFWDNEVLKETEAVLDRIKRALERSLP